MLVQSKPPLHLSYCMNIHPGESGEDVITAVREGAAAVRARVAPNQAFGLGLRLGARAVEDLADCERAEAFAALLAEHHFYAFTVNAFPFGRFHAGPVKEWVYQPDWTAPERSSYTKQVAGLLAALMPREASGSISTVPCGGPGRLSPEAERQALEHLVQVVAHLEELSFRCGQDLHLGLEPEPGCHLETTTQAIDFLKMAWRDGAPLLATRLGMRRAQAEDVMRRRLGVCFDTCHVALQFEDLAWAWDRYLAEGVRISKLQISAAVACAAGSDAREALRAFAEPVYLHQTHVRRHDGSIRRWIDLPDALEAWPSFHADDEVRVHFHVPLGWTGSGLLHSTAKDMTQLFWDRVRRGACAHLEIETYTFDVLPAAVRRGSVVDSIVGEFAWVRRQLA
jgi:sugar phosphate isomerase/epimerase